MKNKFSLAGTCLLLLSCILATQGQQPAPTNSQKTVSANAAAATTNAAADQFKPLPRYRSATDPNRTTVYVVGQPKGQLLTHGMTPNYVVANGKIIPYTNLTRNVGGFQNHPKPGVLGPSSMMNPHLTVAAQKEFQKSLVAFTDLKKNEPDKVSHVEVLISAANKDPEVQKKLEEIRRYVHDYIAKKSPADLQTLEIMTKPKEILEHNGVPGNLVY